MGTPTGTEFSHTDADYSSPVAPQERIEALDILRGFALLGILLVQITHYLDPFQPRSGTDNAVSWFVGFFAASKFYPLFAFLFGVGFAIQMERAATRAGRFLPSYLRRLAVLLLIGVAFYLFVQRYTILIYYAILGAPLLLFRRRSQRTLLLWSVILLAAASSVWQVQLAFRQSLRSAAASEQGGLEESAARRLANDVVLEEATSTGSYSGLVLGRARRLYLSPLNVLEFGTWPSIFAMFLLGLYAHRRGAFADTAANRIFQRRVMLGGFLTWAALTLAVQPMLGPPVRVLPWLEVGPEIARHPWVKYLPTQNFAAAALTITYAAAVLLLLRREPARRGLGLLGWVGRMGLTNYVLHYVIVGAIFYGLGIAYGLGQWVGPVFAALVTLLSVLLSVFWLRRFRFGPLEWLWRSLTYGRKQRLRVALAERPNAPVPYLRPALALTVLLAVGAVALIWQPAERKRADAAAISHLEQAWRDALLTGNVTRLSGIAVPHYRFKSADALEIRSLKDLSGALTSGDLRFEAITPARSVIVTNPRTGSASGVERQVVVFRGSRSEAERRYNHWYIRRDGQWRMVSSESAPVW